MNRKSPFPYNPPLERLTPRGPNAPGISAPRRQYNEFHVPDRSAPFSSGYSNTDQLYSSSRAEPFNSAQYSQTKNISGEVDTWRSSRSNHSSNSPRAQTEKYIPNRRISNYSRGCSYNQNYRAAEMNAADTSYYYNCEPGAARNSIDYLGKERDMPGEHLMYFSHPINTKSNVPTNPNATMSTIAVSSEQNQTKVKAHKCEVCNETFFVRKSLNRHIRLRHTNSGPPIKVSCDICGKQFKNNHRLFKHHRDSHGIHGRKEPEEKNNVPMSSEKSEVENLSNIPEVQNPPEESEVQQSTEKSEDQKYTNFLSNDSKGIMPSELSTYFLHPTSTSNNASTNPDARMSTITVAVEQNQKKVRPHKCEACNKSFYLRSALDRHIRLRHTNIDPRIFEVSCDICGKGFKKKDRLFRHQKDSHGMHGKKKLKEKTYVPKPSEKSGVENPLEISEVQNPPEESEVQKPVEKSEDQESSSDTNLHRTSWKNNVPTNPNATMSTIAVSVEQNQTKVKAHKCEVCNETFFVRKSLNRHIRLRHTNSGPPIKVSCDICGKQFKNNHRLFKHRRDSHGMHGRNEPEEKN